MQSENVGRNFYTNWWRNPEFKERHGRCWKLLHGISKPHYLWKKRAVSWMGTTLEVLLSQIWRLPTLFNIEIMCWLVEIQCGKSLSARAALYSMLEWIGGPKVAEVHLHNVPFMQGSNQLCILHLRFLGSPETECSSEDYSKGQKTCSWGNLRTRRKLLWGRRKCE